MVITVEVKWIPDGKEEVCKKVLFNIVGCNQVGEEIVFFNIDGSQVFRILSSELVSIDFQQ